MVADVGLAGLAASGLEGIYGLAAEEGFVKFCAQFHKQQAQRSTSNEGTAEGITCTAAENPAPMLEVGRKR